jgi:hypothetical protein
MARKPKRLPLHKLPRCDGSDGSLADGTVRCCRALPTHRIEWMSGTPTRVRGGYRWELRTDQELSCDRHLPTLLERAERATGYARSPFREWSPTEVPDPVLIRLEFVLDKRATAYGDTLYIPVETPMAGPVEFKLF